MSSSGKSIISLSMHKAGSTIIDRILTDVLTEKGMALDRIDQRVPSSPLTEGEIFINYQEKMILNGVYYGVARGAYVSEMPIIDKLKIIVQVRDPRDCITSAYFSFKTSHVPPEDPEKRNAFMERRKKIENLSIDEYALTQVGGYKYRMSILHDIIQRHNDALILKYEDMVECTEEWLAQISDFVGQPITPALRQKLGDKIDFVVDKEDASRHKRQVAPGDHKRKLRPETAAAMSRRLSGELTDFGYPA